MRFKFSTQRMTVFQKILISIGAFCVVFAAYFAWGYSQIKPLMPSEGYVYPSAPTLTGVYDCCGNVPNTAYSKVDGVQINCAKPGFGMGGSTRLGDKRTACWLTNLNGKTVSVERKMLPISGGSFFPSSLFQVAYVVKIQIPQQNLYAKIKEENVYQWDHVKTKQYQALHVLGNAARSHNA